jgi:hypothetical protein
LTTHPWVIFFFFSGHFVLKVETALLRPTDNDEPQMKRHYNTHSFIVTTRDEELKNLKGQTANI